MEAAKKRYALLDELRGLCLVNMVLYHACWDLVALFGVELKWYVAWPGRLWQKIICCGFVLLSGFCTPLGHNGLKRGAQVFGAGALVTAVTLIFMPEDRVLFGVLTLLGTSMMLTALCSPLLERISPAAGLVGAGALFALTNGLTEGYLGLECWQCGVPQYLYANHLTAFLGFPPEGFWSADYFPILPWIFLFWSGYFLHRLIGRKRMEPLYASVCPALGWMGRKSLLLYLLHQPAIYGALIVFFWLVKH